MAGCSKQISLHAFQGIGEEGLQLLAEARAVAGLPVVSEADAPEHINLVAKYADIIQIGARNMEHYPLLFAAGNARVPIPLNRGVMSTLEELLLSAEYILDNGNTQLMLCEHGIRTFEDYTRTTTDINAMPVLKQMTHLAV